MRYWMAVALMYAIQNRVPSGEFGCRCEAGERGKRLLEKKKNIAIFMRISAAKMTRLLIPAINVVSRHPSRRKIMAVGVTCHYVSSAIPATRTSCMVPFAFIAVLCVVVIKNFHPLTTHILYRDNSAGLHLSAHRQGCVSWAQKTQI